MEAISPEMMERSFVTARPYSFSGRIGRTDKKTRALRQHENDRLLLVVAHLADKRYPNCPSLTTPYGPLA